MSKRIEDFKVVENKRLTTDCYILEIEGSDKLPAINPGQFVQVRVDGSPETFLRRPISVYDVNYQNNRIKLLIQIVGKGTEKLSELKSGDNLNIIYPLGNSFGKPSEKDRMLLIGGGVGIAPLYYMGKHLKSEGYKPDFLLGFRNKERIIEYKDFSEIGEVFITTEDGSVGEKGYVTNHSILDTTNYNRIYCCGPDSMMKAVGKYAAKNDIQCEVSLENLMACGIGACLCCIVDTVHGNLCSCIDGPVFNIKDLKW
jgi:dihydroorotate dehydrogenase electron transfer subunit